MPYFFLLQATREVSSLTVPRIVILGLAHTPVGCLVDLCESAMESDVRYVRFVSDISRDIELSPSEGCRNPRRVCKAG